jgi:hypothetical protein
MKVKKEHAEIIKLLSKEDSVKCFFRGDGFYANKIENPHFIL